MEGRKYIYLEYIDCICDKGDFNKEVLSFFIKNNGTIEDIIEGVEVLIDSEGEAYKLILSDVLTVKKDAISNNSLYNIANYCILNNAKKVGCQNNKHELNISLVKNKLFNNKVLINNDYNPENGSYLIIEISINDIVPNKCDYRLLDSNNEKSLFIDFIEFFPNTGFFDGYYNYAIDINIDFTNCLNSNMLLIKKWIDNVCIDYVNRVDWLKKYNEKYFTNQIMQRNINDF